MNDGTKRRLLFFGGLATIAVGWQMAPRIYDSLSSDFDFEPLDDPTGYRKISGGEISAPVDVFAGLDAGPSRDLSAAEASVDADFEEALFAEKQRENAVQVAYFSDFYCPYCRILSSDLIEAAKSENIDITWHEVPLFGEPSELAARAAIAAGEQGAYVPFHDALVSRPVVVTRPYLARLADDLGLDQSQFWADFDSVGTQQNLDRASVLFDRFRLIGTPGLVVGRTLVQGRITPTNLRQLIAREREDGHLG